MGLLPKIIRILRRWLDALDAIGKPEPAAGKEDAKAVMPQGAAVRPRENRLPDLRAKADQIPINVHEAEDSKQWWYCPERESPPFPVIEAVSDAAVYTALRDKVEASRMKMIEIPQHIIQTVRIMSNPEFSYDEVTSLIKRSPVMTGEFLKIVNSAAYSRGVTINDLRVALPRLGRDSIKAMLFLYSSKHTVASNQTLTDLSQQIISHCNLVALICRYLSQRYFPDPDMAFLAGLLHDIGKIAIIKELSEDYDFPELDFKITEDSFSSIFPQLHAMTGRLLALSWNINDQVIKAIEHHHDYLEAEFDDDSQVALCLSALVDLSDTMARILGRGSFISGIDIFQHPACQQLNIERDNSTIEFFKPISHLATKEDDA